MKITRSELKKLVLDTVHKNESILLEMPGDEGTYNYRDDEASSEPVDLTGQKLYHIARQADQLHDMLKGDHKLVEKVRGDILDIADKLREIFEAVTHDKDNPEGR